MLYLSKIMGRNTVQVPMTDDKVLSSDLCQYLHFKTAYEKKANKKCENKYNNKPSFNLSNKNVVRTTYETPIT